MALIGGLITATGAGVYISTRWGSNHPPGHQAGPLRFSWATVAVDAPDQHGSGTSLGAYDIELPAGYSVPLDAAKPSPADYTLASQGDLGEGNGKIAPSGNGDQMILLKAGVTPTYQTCTETPPSVQITDNKVGVAFCLIEYGKIAGVTITSITQQPAYSLGLHVVVWKHSL